MAITTSSDFSLWFSNTADKAPGTSGLSTGGLYINTADGKMWLATSTTTKVALAVNAEEISVASTSGKKLYLLGSESSSGDQKLYSDSGIVYSSETSNKGLTVTGYLKCDSILDMHGSHPSSGNVPLGCADNNGKFYWGTIGEIVSASQSISSGTKIGSITIGDRTTEFYAPTVDVENGSTVSASASYNSTNGISIGSITIDGSTTTLYSPKIVDSSNKTYVFAKYTPAAADNAYIVAVNSTTDGYYELRKFPGLEFVNYQLKTTHPLYIDEGATVQNDPLVVNTSVDTKKVRTLSNGSYTAGTAGQVLMSGGSDGDVYWSDLPESSGGSETASKITTSSLGNDKQASIVLVASDGSMNTTSLTVSRGSAQPIVSMDANLDVTYELSTGTIKSKTFKIPTSKGGSTYGVGTAGQVLMSGGNSGAYWSDLPESGSSDSSGLTYDSDGGTPGREFYPVGYGNDSTLVDFSSICYTPDGNLTLSPSSGVLLNSPLRMKSSPTASTYTGGNAGQVLISNGNSTAPYWGDVSGFMKSDYQTISLEKDGNTTGQFSTLIHLPVFNPNKTYLVSVDVIGAGRIAQALYFVRFNSGTNSFTCFQLAQSDCVSSVGYRCTLSLSYSGANGKTTVVVNARKDGQPCDAASASITIL